MDDNSIRGNLISEEQRNYCYQLDNLNDYMHEKWDLDITEIETGSTTECCGIFSDIDRMLFTKDFIVVESIEQISEKHSKGVLLMDTSDCHPGYVRLKLERPHPEGKMDLFTELNGDYFLLASKFKWFVIRQKKDAQNAMKGEQHGPAFTVKGSNFSNERDMVTCLKCDFWPSKLEGTLKR